MQSHVNFLIFVMLAVLVPACIAQETVALPEEPAVEVNDVNIPLFPYVAEVIADSVNFRSGPGTNYYSCGMLNKADRIKVVGSQFSWSRIVPSAGSFSWISKQYVEVDPNNSSVGTVTGDSVRVYAGSEQVKPIHSTTVQVKLGKGDEVSLVGEEGESDYYKIVPPEGSYFWISTEYTKPVGAIGPIEVFVTPAVDTNEVVASVETEKLREYYVLQKQVEDERVKPLIQQDYTNIKKAFLEIVDNKEAGKAARYAEFAIRQIGRFELAVVVAKEIELQDTQLQQVREGIKNARAARLAEVIDLGRFTAVGQFQASKVYGEEQQLKHYRIVDDSGKTVCYALPSESISKTDLDKFIGLEVGLIGTIEPHVQTSNVLVRFTEIVKLKK